MRRMRGFFTCTKGELEGIQEASSQEDASQKLTPQFHGTTMKPVASVPAPDGPKSWFMAAVCFLVNLLFSSFFRCGGLFFTKMMSVFGVTRAQASLPLSVYCGFVNLSGFVAGPLIHILGLRVCVFLGGLLMSAGCMASGFADGISFLVVSIGVVTGSGHGILLACVIVAINEYFDARRGTALGINMTGATAASFFFPKVFELCLEKYGLQATYALVGAFLLNIVPISLLFHRPPWMYVNNSKIAEARDIPTKKQQRKEHVPNAFSCIEEQYAMPSSNSHTPQIFPVPHIVQYFCNPLSLSYSLTKELISKNIQTEKRYGYVYTLGKSISCDIINKNDEDSAVRFTGLSAIDAPSSAPVWAFGVQYERYYCLPACRRCEEGPASREPCHISVDFTQKRRASSLEDLSGRIHGGVSIAPQSKAGGAIEANIKRSTIGILNGLLLPKNHHYESVNERMLVTEASVGGNETRAKDPLKAPHLVEKDLPTTVAGSTKIVLAMPRFYAQMLSYFSFCFYLDTFLAVAVDCASDAGISQAEAAHVLTFFSITDTAGRLAIPLKTDYDLASPLSAMTASYFIMAVIGTSLPHSQSSTSFWALVVTLGLPVGYVMVATSQTIAAEVGVRNLPVAYGLVAGLTAVGAFLRPLIIGVFRDTSGSYSGLFHLMGGMVFLSFLLTGWLWWTHTPKP